MTVVPVATPMSDPRLTRGSPATPHSLDDPRVEGTGLGLTQAAPLYGVPEDHVEEVVRERLMASPRHAWPPATDVGEAAVLEVRFPKYRTRTSIHGTSSLERISRAWGLWVFGRGGVPATGGASLSVSATKVRKPSGRSVRADVEVLAAPARQAARLHTCKGGRVRPGEHDGVPREVGVVVAQPLDLWGPVPRRRLVISSMNHQRLLAVREARQPRPVCGKPRRMSDSRPTRRPRRARSSAGSTPSATSREDPLLDGDGLFLRGAAHAGRTGSPASRSSERGGLWYPEGARGHLPSKVRIVGSPHPAPRHHGLVRAISWLSCPISSPRCAGRCQPWPGVYVLRRRLIQNVYLMQDTAKHSSVVVLSI